MEKVNTILNNIKERFTNPLIFSFICSWLIFNWEVIITLLWQDAHQIENEGYTSIYKFIKAKLSEDGSFSHPFWFAIGYTLLMPILKNLVSALYTWASKWGGDWNLKILKGGQISIDKFLKLRAGYEERTKSLEEVISKESSYLQQYNKLDTQLLNVQDKLNEMTNKFNVSDKYARELLDISMLNGGWECAYNDKHGMKGTERVYIENGGKYFIINDRGQRRHAFDIMDFHYDNRNGNVFFVKEVVSEDKNTRPKGEHFNINRLRFEGKDLLVGNENGNTEISYTRYEKDL